MKRLVRCTLLIGIVSCLTVISHASKSLSMNMEPFFPEKLGKVRLVKETTIEKGETKVSLERDVTAYKVNFKGRDVFIRSQLDTSCWELEMEGFSWDEEGYKFVGEIKCEDKELQSAIFDPPLLFLPRDLSVGEMQTWDIQEGGSVSVELEAVDETVQVPAGTFSNAIRLHWQLVSEGESNVCTLWAVAGIGEVRSHCVETSENGSEETIEELVALVKDGQLTGSPILSQYPFSFFGLATVSTDQCGMVINDIVFEKDGVPEMWWATFIFDSETLSWKLHGAGKGQNAHPPVQVCTIEGLDFGPPTLLGLRNVAGVPEIVMRVELDGKRYGITFRFDIDTLSWNLSPNIVDLNY